MEENRAMTSQLLGGGEHPPIPAVRCCSICSGVHNKKQGFDSCLFRTGLQVGVSWVSNVINNSYLLQWIELGYDINLPQLGGAIQSESVLTFLWTQADDKSMFFPTGWDNGWAWNDVSLQVSNPQVCELNGIAKYCYLKINDPANWMHCYLIPTHHL